MIFNTDYDTRIEKYEEFMNLGIKERFNKIKAIIMKSGLNLQDDPDLEADEVLETYEYSNLFDILKIYIPKHEVKIFSDYFGAYSMDEARDVYPELWIEMLGVINIVKVRNDFEVEMPLDGIDEINISFKNLSTKYDYSYRHDSSYLDDSFIDDFESFAKSNKIDLAFLFDDLDDDVNVGGFILPRSIIHELDSIKPVEY
jgi:hypothetical protein